MSQLFCDVDLSEKRSDFNPLCFDLFPERRQSPLLQIIVLDWGILTARDQAAADQCVRCFEAFSLCVLDLCRNILLRGK